MKRIFPYLKITLAIIIAVLLVAVIINLDVAVRAANAVKSGTFSMQRLRYDLASFDLGRKSPVTPADSKTAAVDGMVQLLVPAGEFTMGRGKDNGVQSPSHTVFLEAFWVDRTEVSNAMYRKCVEAGVCDPPTLRLNPFYGRWAYRNYPVVYVSWHQAQAYCAWAGRRLPTEAEWEKAARGTDERRYPWGNEPPTPRLANYVGSLIGEPVPVARYPLGASPYGALNMVGNVREWVEDWYLPTYYSQSPSYDPHGAETGSERSMRSGAYDADANEILTTSRYKHEPDSAGLSRGFRCAESGE